MKRSMLLTAALLLAITFSGCLTTLHPLFTAKDLLFDPRLVGTWKYGDEGFTATYEKTTAASFNGLPQTLQSLTGKSYLFTVREKGKEVQKYLAFLLRLGDNLYMDYYPVGTAEQQAYATLYRQQSIPMHTIYRLRFRDDRTFDQSQLDKDYLQNLITNKKVRIRHEKNADGAIVVTAPTEELQQYVLKYGNAPEAYETANTYAKIQ